MPNMLELKKTAADLGLSFKARVTKPVLEAMIAEEKERRAEESNKRFVDANSTRMPPRLLPNSPPRNVPMDNKTRENNYQTANGTSKLTGKQTKRLRQKANRSR